MHQIPLDPLELRSYFFDAGIRIKCLRCGACCTVEPGTIYVSHEEIVPLAAHLRLSVDDFIQQYLYPFKDSYSIGEHADGRCLFYEDGCRIYPVRPKQCRTFPFWVSILRSEARWDSIRRACPGIGKGRIYSKEEILDILGSGR